MKKKLIIFCIAVGLSLTLATTSFAAPTLDINPASLGIGNYLGTVADPVGTIPTVFGNVKFFGEIRMSPDLDLPGLVFDVANYNQPNPRTASLTFDFYYNVTDITFKYAGNEDYITVEAWDIDGNLLDSFTGNTYGDGINPYGAPVGPHTLYAGTGNSIYKLTWKDIQGSDPQLKYDLASLQDVSLTAIPAPGAILLGSIGVGLVGWLRRKRTL